MLLTMGRDQDDMPHWKEFGNPWSGPRDGSPHWCGDDYKESHLNAWLSDPGFSEFFTREELIKSFNKTMRK